MSTVAQMEGGRDLEIVLILVTTKRMMTANVSLSLTIFRRETTPVLMWQSVHLVLHQVWLYYIVELEFVHQGTLFGPINYTIVFVKNYPSGLSGAHGQELGQINFVAMVKSYLLRICLSWILINFVQGDLNMERKRSCIKAKDRALKWSLNYEIFYWYGSIADVQQGISQKKCLCKNLRVSQLQRYQFVLTVLTKRTRVMRRELRVQSKGECIQLTYYPRVLFD